MKIAHMEYGNEVWTHSVHISSAGRALTPDYGQAQYDEYVSLDNTWKVGYLSLAVF